MTALGGGRVAAQGAGGERRRLMGGSRVGAMAVAAFVASLSAPAVVAAQDAVADPLPPEGTILEAGRYVSRFVGPAIEFKAGPGWIVGRSGDGPIFTLEYLESPGTVLSVTRFDGETFLDSCDPTSMATVEATVPRLTEIIAGNPYLDAGPPRIVEVDGFTGLQFDAGVPPYTLEECALRHVLIWAIPVGQGGEFVQMAHQQSRFLVLDVAGDVIVIAIESFPGVPFGGLLEASMELIETMDITPGSYVPPAPPSQPPPGASPSPGPSPTESVTTQRRRQRAAPHVGMRV